MSAVLIEVGRVIEDFDKFSDDDGRFKDVMGELPTKYEYDYIIFSASNSLEEEETLWLMDWMKVIKRMMFKKFNGYIQNKLLEKDGE